MLFLLRWMQLVDASTFFKCISDNTRLKLVLLVLTEGELCVCEFAAALQQSQPKVSRHLAQLRNCGLLSDRRVGQWVFYNIHPQLPSWCKAVMMEVRHSNSSTIAAEQSRLTKFKGGPDRAALCCKEVV